jgi:hypothetical protein
MLNNILALHPDTPSSKLYPMHSGSLTRVPELPAGTTCLPATSSSTALVHPRTRMRHLSDGFRKVRISVSFHRISLSTLSYREDAEKRKGGTYYLQQSLQTVRKVSMKWHTTHQCSSAHLQLTHAFPCLGGVKTLLGPDLDPLDMLVDMEKWSRVWYYGLEGSTEK